MTTSQSNSAASARLAYLTLLAGLCLSVVACGGGGSDGGTVAPVPKPEPEAPAPTPAPEPSTPEPEPQPVSLTVNNMQGRWENPTEQWDAKWLLPVSGQTLSPIWVLSRDGRYLSYLEGAVASDGSVRASGKRFDLTLPPSSAGTVSNVNWEAKATLNGTATDLKFSNGVALTRSAPEPQSQQRDATGTWQANLRDNLVSLNWFVDAQGVVRGTSTTGCNYGGFVVARPGSAVFDARISEACIDGTETFLSGIASLVGDKNRLTFTLLGPDSAYAKVLYFAK